MDSGNIIYFPEDSIVHVVLIEAQVSYFVYQHGFAGPLCEC
jgi:hypothetical protein